MAGATAIQPLRLPLTVHRPRPATLSPRACRECAADTANAVACAARQRAQKTAGAWRRAQATPLAALGNGRGDISAPVSEEGQGAEGRTGAGGGGAASSSSPSSPETFASTNPMLPSDADSPALAAALAALRFYKAAISPLLPASCRFLPTCSEYSAAAYRKFGIGKGTVLTAWRLLRCQPWGGRGFDPPVWPPPGLRGTGGGGEV